MHVNPKLLVLTQTHNIWGGIEAWMADVFPYIESAGWSIEYGLAVGNRYNRPSHFLAHHTYIKRTHILDGRVGTPVARQNAIRRLLLHAQPDVVMPLAIGDALPALREERYRGLKTRVLFPVHSLHIGTLADILENEDLIDVAGVVSGLLSRWANIHIANNYERTRWIRNGVPEPTVARSNRDHSVLRVGYVGRLENGSKRIGDLPSIIESAVNHGASIRLEIVGDGPAASEVASRLLEIQGWQNYCLYGRKDRSIIYKEILPNLDCMLLTSVTEGSPLSVIEAMHHGVVPVVSQFHGHAAEGMLHPEENCLMFPVGDIRSAAKQLHRLACDTPLLNRLSESAKITAKLYTRDEMQHGWLSALTDLLRLPPKPCLSRTASFSPQFGRLDRWGFPEGMANWLRRLRPGKFAHASGFDEWPGSLSSDAQLMEQIKNELMAIESECFANMHSSRMLANINS